MSRAVKQGVFRDGNGAVVNTARAGTVSVFLAGTTNPVDIYTASTGGATVHSVNTDASGRFKFYIDYSVYLVGQKFDIVLSGTGINSQTYQDELVYLLPFAPYEVDAILYGSNTFTQTSITAVLTAIGTTNKVTLLLRPGNWVILTALAFPVNVAVVMPPGAYFSGAGQVTFANNQQVTPQMWGFSSSASAATNSTALNSALAASKNVHIPAGSYSFNGATFQHGITARNGQRLTGDGILNTILTVTSGNIGLKMWGETPPAFIDALVNTYVADIGIVGADLTCTGIDMYAVLNTTFKDIKVTNCNYGIKARTTINIVFLGQTELTGNNVGLKIPPYSAAGVAATQNLCANVWKFDLLNIRANYKAGASVGNAGNWTLSSALVEANKVGFYLGGVVNFVVTNLYQENLIGAAGPNDRFGTSLPWTLYMGQDEDAVSNTTMSNNIQFKVVTDGNASGLYFHLAYVDIVHTPPNSTVELGTNVTNLSMPSISSDSISQSQVSAVGRNIAKGVLRSHNANLIANGNFAYPNPPLIFGDDATTPLTSAQASIVASETIGGLTTRTLKVKLPSGDTSYNFYFPFLSPTGSEFNNSSISVHASAQVKASTADITAIAMALLDTNRTVTTNLSLATGLTAFQSMSLGGNINKNAAASLNNSIRFTVTRTTAAIDDYIYIDEIVVIPANLGVSIVYPSVFDVLTGLTFTGTTSVDGGGGLSYYVEFTHNYDIANNYTVLAGIDAKDSVWVVKSTNTFRVYTVTTGVGVTALLIPRTFITP